jgi:hypothetical protein
MTSKSNFLKSHLDSFSLTTTETSTSKENNQPKKINPLRNSKSKRTEEKFFVLDISTVHHKYQSFDFSITDQTQNVEIEKKERKETVRS